MSWQRIHKIMFIAIRPSAQFLQTINFNVIAVVHSHIFLPAGSITRAGFLFEMGLKNT